MFPQSALASVTTNQDLLDRIAVVEAERNEARAERDEALSRLVGLRDENVSLRQTSSRIADTARDMFLEVIEDDSNEDSEDVRVLTAFFEGMGWEVPELTVDFEAEVTITVTVSGKVRRGNLNDRFIHDAITSLSVSMDTDSDIENFEVTDEVIDSVDAREV